jgi:hypothetical protein
VTGTSRGNLADRLLRRRSMGARRFRSGVILSVVFAAAIIAPSTPALAKGPQSATVTGPGIDRPIELMDTANTDLLGRLMEQTGLWYASGDVPLPSEEPQGKLGPGYTLTWINAGPPGEGVDERTIRQVLYLDAEDSPVIHTPAQESLRGWGPGMTGWFRARSGLRDTLAELGVPFSAASSFREAPPETGADRAELESPGAFSDLGVVGLALVVWLAWARSAAARLRAGGLPRSRPT